MQWILSSSFSRLTSYIVPFITLNEQVSPTEVKRFFLTTDSRCKLTPLYLQHVLGGHVLKLAFIYQQALLNTFAYRNWKNQRRILLKLLRLNELTHKYRDNNIIYWYFSTVSLCVSLLLEVFVLLRSRCNHKVFITYSKWVITIMMV